MNCSKCNNELSNKFEKGVCYQYCEKCDGVLIGFNNLQKLSKLLDLKSDIVNIEDLETINTKEQKRICPDCNTEMEKVYFNGVLIDVCKKCKLAYFDEGELSKFFKLFLKNESTITTNANFIQNYTRLKPKTYNKTALNESNFKSKEKTVWSINGFVAIFIEFLFIIIDIFLYLAGAYAFGIILSAVLFFALAGFKLLKPQEAMVLTLFGKYIGTLKGAGFFYVNPLAQNTNNLTLFGPISLKTRTLQNDKQKINDEMGNPIVVSIVVVWKVEDTAKATFDVQNYEEFLSVQSDSALRSIVRMYPYDAPENSNRQSLRADSGEISEKLKAEIQKNVLVAGIQVIDAKITHLAYASEIAIAMLQRQQAAAIIDAKRAIVEGAVTTVEETLKRLQDNNIAELSQEQKAQMVNNLLVVLCSNKEAQPVVTTT